MIKKQCFLGSGNLNKYNTAVLITSSNSNSFVDSRLRALLVIIQQ